MAKEEEKQEGAPEKEISPEEAAAKAKKKKLLFLVVGGVVLLAGIGGGLMFVLGGGDEAQMAAKAHEGEAAKEAAAPEEGHEAQDPKAAAEPAEKSEDGAHEAKEGAKPVEATKKAEPGFGCTTDLKPFHLNLGNPLENRYIRLGIAIEHACSEELKGELERRLPQLRDAVIAITSRKTREFLLGPDGKAQLRKEVTTRINQYMNQKITDVYITDILIE